MLTCGTNFNHLVEYKDRKDHELVTEGVYGISRHPSYVGWAYWAVGTQLILGNFLCLFGYAYVTFWFFSERIPDEEKTLIEKEFLKVKFLFHTRVLRSSLKLRVLYKI